MDLVVLNLFVTLVGTVTIIGFGSLWVAYLTPTIINGVKAKWSMMPQRKVIRFYKVVDKLPPYNVECLCYKKVCKRHHYYVAVYKQGFDSNYWTIKDTQANSYDALAPDEWALLT